MAMSLPVFVVVLVLTAMRGAAQVTPASWRKSNITTPLAERVRLAGAALDTAIDRLGIDGYFITDDATGTAGDLYAQMALFDMATNQSKYETALGQYFEVVLQSGVNFSNSGLPHPFISDSLAFGHAAAHAYTAYDRNPIFLQYAVDSWWWGREHTLSMQDISARRFPRMNFTLVKVCQNATMAGGTFQNNDPNNSLVEGYASGYFLVLSALLAEATSDSVYLKAATESLSFIQSHLYKVNNTVEADISASAGSSPCSVGSDTDPTQSGLMIEGLAILSSFTKNASTQNLLNELLLAVIPNTAWQGENGIVSEGADSGGGDMNLLRGLGAVYSRNLTTPELHRYIGDYIAVQFNAVVDLATSNGTDIYGDSWSGPPSADFSGLNQTDALGALISAIYLESDSMAASSASLSPAPTSSASLVPTPVPHHGRSKIGAIVGGTIGGVVALGIIAAALWFRQKRERPPPVFPSALLYEPFPGATPSPFIPSKSTAVTSPPSFHTAPGSPPPAFHLGTKPGEPQNSPRSPQVGSVALGGLNRMRSQAVGPDIEQAAEATSVLPTERLITLLNQRLQGRPWDEEDTPPDYPFTESTTNST
ncbi:hypothetical protein C8F04DRAFT_420451 [Mycena alexandri]|uniref:Glycoside hydrolase family 76 protein n=1 Tax=Mycena alexandri TaxID=1745969 RepID=A0AAD6T0M5_9AGAR|nr:hypothetical protein C8F04DRAFT_420451 [Mycena alexandri]